MSMLNQMFQLFLTLVALDVTVGLVRGENVWDKIIVYWLFVFIQHFMSWIGGLL